MHCATNKIGGWERASFASQTQSFLCGKFSTARLEVSLTWDQALFYFLILLLFFLLLCFFGSRVTWDQALFYFLSFFLLLCFVGSRGKKNNAWYIYLTSRQPPPNLHNLTSAWPVMLLANKRLPYGNQILAQIMSLEINFRGKKMFNYVHVQVAILKKKISCVVFVMKSC